MTDLKYRNKITIKKEKKIVEGRKITLNIIIYRTKVPVKNKMWIELDWKDKINYLDFS